MCVTTCYLLKNTADGAVAVAADSPLPRKTGFTDRRIMCAMAPGRYNTQSRIGITVELIFLLLKFFFGDLINLLKISESSSWLAIFFFSEILGQLL